MAERHQLAVGSEPLQRLLLELRGVTRDVVEDPGLQTKKAPLIHSFGSSTFSWKATISVAGEVEAAEPARRVNRGQRAMPAVPLVEREQPVQIDVGKPVAPGQHERPRRRDRAPGA